MNLVESLKGVSSLFISLVSYLGYLGPFGQCNMAVKKELVETLVSTLNIIRKSHTGLAQNSDLLFQ